MNKRYLTIISRIREELSEIKKIADRSQEAWGKAKKLGDDLYIDSAALNIHSFYAGLERIFKLIAEEIDESLPQGKSWHHNLLKQMATEIEKVRPAVISDDTLNGLDEYRGFRHIVRNIYTFQLSEKRIKPLINELPELCEQIEMEIEKFLNFLEEINSY